MHSFVIKIDVCKQLLDHKANRTVLKKILKDFSVTMIEAATADVLEFSFQFF